MNLNGAVIPNHQQIFLFCCCRFLRLIKLCEYTKFTIGGNIFFLFSIFFINRCCCRGRGGDCFGDFCCRDPFDGGNYSFSLTGELFF